MAQLETLEAKMASIEVSLSTTPRRKKNGSIGGGSKASIVRVDPISRELDHLRLALRDKENVIQSLKGQINHTTTPTTPGTNGGGIGGLPFLKSNGNGPPINHTTQLTSVERKHAEDRLARVKAEMDNKRLAIKNLKIALERLDITDNIDVRIQQAELEYQLGREELNALSLLEEARALQLCLEDIPQTSKPQTTLYSCTRGCSGYVTLHAIEVKYDAKSPRFGAAPKDNNPGLYVEWALDDTELCKGDRVVEVNGKLVLNKTKEDMLRLLAVAPNPAQIVVLRNNVNNFIIEKNLIQSATSNEVGHLRAELEVVKERAEEAQRMKEGLKGDNLRLTHRISYLEEQVAELLHRKNSENNNNHVQEVQKQVPPSQSQVITSTVKNSQNITNISITSPPPSPNRNSDLQIFQKGPQVTALVANLPGLETDNRDMLRTLRPRSSHSNISSTHIPAPEDINQRTRHSRYSSQSSTRTLDYNSENSSVDHRKSSSHHHHHHHHQRRNPEEKYSSHHRKSSHSDHENNNRYHHSNRIIHDSHSHDELDQDSEPSSRLYDTRSVKSLDFDSEPCINNNHYTKSTKVHSMKNVDYTSEPIANDKKIQSYYQRRESADPRQLRPKPPKKPIRLSLHRAQSLQSVETNPTQLSCMSNYKDDKKPLKRNHKGEAPPAPSTVVKIERPTEQPPQPPPHKYENQESNSRASSRSDNHSALRWPTSLHYLSFVRSSSSNRHNGHLSDGGKWC
ncbi:probable serine/threonine-protein kinase MARK-A [Chrysoperla carnea]|uniref:probable serine/threonine-protein kinase MARK-A n=1 Tax=Chrysoperla carnea TaxID=189513 RepID=UPI001D077830|nr:probable serine/threonine-protein kinase MARK-A [Chrysoperla carnea]